MSFELVDSSEKKFNAYMSDQMELEAMEREMVREDDNPTKHNDPYFHEYGENV